jgi:hypothetical protein
MIPANDISRYRTSCLSEFEPAGVLVQGAVAIAPVRSFRFFKLQRLLTNPNTPGAGMALIRTDFKALSICSLGAGTAMMLVNMPVAWQPGNGKWTVDSALLDLGIATMVFAALMLIAHIALLSLKSGQGWMYLAAGMLVSFATFAGLHSGDLVQQARAGKMLSLVVVTIMLFGAMLGVVYYAIAGPRRPHAAPDHLARWLGIEPEAYTDFDSAEFPVVDTGAEKLFSGPTQVHTSFAIMVLACLLPWLILLLGGLALYWAGAGFVEQWSQTYAGQAPDELFDTPGLRGPIVVSSIVGMLVLAALQAGFGLAIHNICRYFKITRSGGYALMGFAMSFVCGLLIFPLILISPMMAISLNIYRRWAGLEPVGLPDPVIVRDPANLISANHPRRSYHQIIEH